MSPSDLIFLIDLARLQPPQNVYRTDCPMCYWTTPPPIMVEGGGAQDGSRLYAPQFHFSLVRIQTVGP